ncbi:MAG: type II toxin-antitoxin system VapC family toxin [Terriglobales bacterium]
MSVLVDSDILIEVSRERNQDVLMKWTQLAESGTAILCSPVSSAELWAGALPREHEATAQLFGTLVCVPIDYEIGRQAGDYLRQYRKSHSVQMSDALIAAAAVLNHAELWTRNRKHYPMKELTFY